MDLTQSMLTGGNFVEGLFLGRMMITTMVIFVPIFFFGGYVTGYVLAIGHNILATSTDFIKVREGFFEFK